MTSADLERRLAELLHERAEGAMSATNTPDKLSDLLVAEERSRERRSRWLVGGAVAAAAAVALTVWFSRSGDTKTIEPTGPVETSAERVATDYLENLWSYDLAAVEAAVTDPRVLDEDGRLDRWRRHQAWLQAARFSLAESRCEEGGTSVDGTTAVHCDYELHALGSEFLRVGPYAGTYDITVQDGEIASVEDDFPFATNAFNAHSWVPFAAYVSRLHPDDVTAMYDKPGQQSAREDAKSRELWERYVAEYIAS